MSSNKGRKILLIDDNKVMHDLARAHLEKSGYRIVSAFDARTGLESVLQHRPDLILLDFMLPEMNGEVVYHELTSNPRYQTVKDVPVIMLTARGADAESKALMLEKGISAYLEKPFGLRELTNVLENVFIIHEITARNRDLRTEVKSTRDYLELIVGTAPIGIFSTDENGSINHINRVLATSLGYQRTQTLIGKSVFEDSDLRDTFLRTAVARVLTGHVAWRIRNYHLNRSGQARRVLNLHSVPIMNDGGQLRGVVGIVEDVTETQKREEQIQILSRVGLALQGVTDIDDLLHLILTTITAGPALGFARALFFAMDRNGGHLIGRMAIGPASDEEANRVWKTLEREHLSLDEFLEKYGKRPAHESLPLDELVRTQKFPLFAKGSRMLQHLLTRRTYRSAVHGVDQSECAATLQKLQLTDFVAVPVVQNERIKGVIFADNLYHAHAIAPEDVATLELLASEAAQALEKGEAYRRLALEKRKLEKAYQQLQLTHDKLIHAERLAAIGNMAAHVAHEIRNPLVTIGGFARKLQRKLQAHEELKLVSEVIADEAIRLEKILNNVLEFTRLPKPSLQQASLNAIIRSVQTMLTDEARASNISLKIEIAPDVPMMFFDPSQIKQLLVNLIKNAFQAIPNSGQVLLQTSRLSGKVVRVTVCDNGPGISSNLQEEIFKPFFTTKSSGTGLGLAVCRQIVNDHGGEISMESQVGVGTSFFVDLPVRSEFPRSLPPASTGENGSPYLS